MSVRGRTEGEQGQTGATVTIVKVPLPPCEFAARAE